MRKNSAYAAAGSGLFHGNLCITSAADHNGLGLNIKNGMNVIIGCCALNHHQYANVVGQVHVPSSVSAPHRAHTLNARCVLGNGHPGKLGGLVGALTHRVRPGNMLTHCQAGRVVKNYP